MRLRQPKPGIMDWKLPKTVNRRFLTRSKEWGPARDESPKADYRFLLASPRLSLGAPFDNFDADYVRREYAKAERFLTVTSTETPITSVQAIPSTLVSSGDDNDVP